MNAAIPAHTPPRPRSSTLRGDQDRQERAERRDQRHAAQEREVAGAEEDAVEREQRAGHGHHPDEPRPQHARLVAHARRPSVKSAGMTL